MAHKATAFLFGEVIFLLVLVGCSHPTRLPRQEAEQVLKTTDSDLNRLLSAAAESSWKVAVQSLYRLKGNPFSALTTMSKGEAGLRQVSYSRWAFPTGHYVWNAQRSTFDYYQSAAASIEVDYPLQESKTNNARCVITAFAPPPVGSNLKVPAALEAAFWVDEKKVLSVSQRMSVQEQLPVLLRCTIKGNDFESQLSLDNHLNGKFGKVQIHNALQVLGQDVFTASVVAGIKLNGGGTYSIQEAQWEAQLFEMSMKGDVQYARINPSSKHYDQDVNRYSSILLKESTSGATIATVLLGRMPNEDRFDFFLQFSDGSLRPLSDYFLAVQQLMIH
ncbi:MAG: hypothetical protein U0Y10_09000 [Spirosomataceae bacterium]